MVKFVLMVEYSCAASPYNTARTHSG